MIVASTLLNVSFRWHYRNIHLSLCFSQPHRYCLPLGSAHFTTCNTGMVVDRKVYRKHEIAPLALRSSIRMGSVKVSFVPANSAGTVGKYHSALTLIIIFVR